jgi:mono/diheme cytochrome c family protein
MKQLINYIFIIVAILSLSACYYDKKDQIYPQAALTTCDTTNSTYAAVVAPILSTNCSNCHGTVVAAQFGAGIVLDNYTSLKPYVTNNFLMNSILQNGTVPPMPLNMPKMDACNIKKIAAWINRGALNN